MSEAVELLAMLEPFHITDRGLMRCRDRVRASADDASVAALRKEMRRYFSAVERESTSHLRALDAKLDDLYQRQYNLQAEHSVAERRLASARGVLSALDAPRERAG